MSDSVDMMANGAASILGGALMYTTEKALGKADGFDRIRPILMLARDSICELIGSPAPDTVTHDGVAWTRLGHDVLAFACQMGVALIAPGAGGNFVFSMIGHDADGHVHLSLSFARLDLATMYAAGRLGSVGWVK